MRLKVISCNVMSRELRFCASRSPHAIDISFLHQGLHEFPKRLNDSITEALSEVYPGQYDYLLLNYGLCGNGTLDIGYDSLPIIIHNVHDCIPLLLGDGNLHRAYTETSPGTFWYSPGWIDGFPLYGCPDYDQRYQELFGSTISEEQRDALGKIMLKNYTRFTYIHWNELGEEVEKKYSALTRESVEQARSRLDIDVEFDRVEGKIDKLQRFVDGDWEGGDFIHIPPGQRLKNDPVKGILYSA